MTTPGRLDIAQTALRRIADYRHNFTSSLEGTGPILHCIERYARNCLAEMQRLAEQAEQPEGEAVLRVEWLHEEFENRSSPMAWPKCDPASATHRRLVSDWMPIVRSAK